jgi:hypothetical protein
MLSNNLSIFFLCIVGSARPAGYKPITLWSKTTGLLRHSQKLLPQFRYSCKGAQAKILIHLLASVLPGPPTSREALFWPIDTIFGAFSEDNTGQHDLESAVECLDLLTRQQSLDLETFKTFLSMKIMKKVTIASKKLSTQRIGCKQQLLDASRTKLK